MNKFLATMKNVDVPVVIYGAGSVGEAVYHLCESGQITVKYFCDDKFGKSKGSLYGIDILTFDEIKIKYKKAVFLIAVANAQRLIRLLESNSYYNYYLINDIMEDVDYRTFLFTRGLSLAVNEIESYIFSHINCKKKDKLYIRNLDFVITERCSLRCEECANLMQYYDHPQDYSYDTLLNNFRQLYTLVDEFYEVRILGGEPFMNTNVAKIVKALTVMDKVRKVVIYTNGTIPINKQDISFFKNEKVLFMITQYGDLSKKVVDMRQLLERSSISYYIHQAEGWTKCASIQQHCRTVEENQKIFNQCCAKDITTLLDSKLYRCPFMAHATNLKAASIYENEYIDLYDDFENIERKKEMIINFLYEKDNFLTCDFCEGRNYDAEEIIPALQLAKPREYIKVR